MAAPTVRKVLARLVKAAGYELRHSRWPRRRRRPLPYAIAATMFREMDMRSWVEKAEAEIRELA